MQLVSTYGAASGKAGGLVASHGRAGAQLRVHHLNRQPRSPSQLQARALTGSLAPAWKALTPTQQRSWAQLASTISRTDRLGQSFHPSGYTLFVSCNRNLLTLGVGILRNAPAAAPSFPPLAWLTAAPLYASLDLPPILAGFAISYGPAVPLPRAGVLRGSAPLPGARQCPPVRHAHHRRAQPSARRRRQPLHHVDCDLRRSPAHRPDHLRPESRRPPLRLRRDTRDPDHRLRWRRSEERRVGKEGRFRWSPHH